ncbi:S8 family serine peptidase [Saccharopolyspora spinosporotrichia]|uniref:S8 family serine peptidase n=1 Tax=Saccharopolyspora erythraea TaxID=1836 RepID=A0ABN1E163_SACER
MVAGALLVLGGLVAAPSPVSAQPGQCAAPADNVVREIPWPQQRLAPRSAWALNQGGSTLVGVVDTGVSAAAPALAGRVLPGQDVLGSGPANNDCAGRGTFMAGLIAAGQTTGVGFAGIAPRARILPIRVAQNPNEVDPGRLAAGIRAAVDGGAKVIAVSMGTPSPAADLRAAVDYAAGRDALVIAASDMNVQDGQTSYPAAFPSVLPVSGIDESGSPANRGGSNAPAQAPALVAPSSNVVSIAPAGAGHITASGGGIGVAFVAGAAALVRSYHPDLSAAQVRHRLEATADHPPAVLPDPALGFGVVDPRAALATVLPEESGDRPTPAPAPDVRVPPVPAADDTPVFIALAVTALTVSAASLGALAAALVTRGRRRKWRSAWAAGSQDDQPAGAVRATTEETTEEDVPVSRSTSSSAL